MKNEFLLFFCFVFRSVEVHFFFFGSQASNRQTQAASSRRERFSFFPCCSRPPCSRLLNCSLCPLVSRALETLVQPTSHAPGRALAAREQRRKGRRSSRSSGLRRRCCSILALAAALPPGAPRVLAGQQQLASQHDDGEPGSKRGPERLLAQLPAGGCSGQGRFGSRSSSSAATATTSEMGRNSDEGATAAAAETCASCSSALRRAQLRPASVAARAAEPDRRVHARVSYETEIIGGGIEKKRETEKRKKFIAHGIAQASLAGVRIFFFSTSSLSRPFPLRKRKHNSSSQDFVTPADQAMENHHPATAAAHGGGGVLTGSRHARSPAAAAPSPLRGFAKRARGSRLAAAAAGGATPGGGAVGGEDSQQQQQGPRGSQQQQAALLPALLRGHHRRPRSPPVATNVFMPRAAAVRPGSPMSSGGSGGSGGGGATAAAAAATAASPAPSLPSPQSLPVVSRYAAEFRELGPLGAGAFSRVVRAAHRLDGREYAVKKSTQELFSPADVARWRQEAQALAAAGTHRGEERFFFF